MEVRCDPSALIALPRGVRGVAVLARGVCCLPTNVLVEPFVRNWDLEGAEGSAEAVGCRTGDAARRLLGDEEGARPNAWCFLEVGEVDLDAGSLGARRLGDGEGANTDDLCLLVIRDGDRDTEPPLLFL